MKIQFLKDHLHYKVGDVDEVVTARANAFVDAGLAEVYDGRKKTVSEKEQEKAEHTPVHEKNAHAGPGRKKK